MTTLWLTEMREGQEVPVVIYPERLHRSSTWAICILAGLNVLDIITTALCLSTGSVEGNLIARWLLDRNLLWPSKIYITATTITMVIAGDSMSEWWDTHRPAWIDKAKAWWERTRLPWFPRIPDLGPFVMHNLTWAVVGVYSLVVTMNTLKYISIVT